MHNETLVIQVFFGGLGDHLFYSHIPRIAKETGKYKYVYISNYSPFRSPDYKTYIWEKNPYVDGFIDAAGISTRGSGNAPKDPKENLLDKVMLDFGLDDCKRQHEPELYFTPPMREDLKDTCLYDPNYVSRTGFFSQKDLSKVIRKNGFQIDTQMKLRDKSIPLTFPTKTLESKSFLDFCSIIVSCKKLYCLTSGTATLASALRKPATVFTGVGYPTSFHHSPLHTYVFVPETSAEKWTRRAKSLVGIIRKSLSQDNIFR